MKFDPSFRFHFLPKEVILCVIQNLETIDDLFHVFHLLQSEKQTDGVVREFCHQMIKVYELPQYNLDVAFFWNLSCFGKPDLCRHPTVCLKCRLYGKGRCLKCKSPVDLTTARDFNREGCNNMIDNTGVIKSKGLMGSNDPTLSCKCNDLVICSCGKSYHPDVYEMVKLTRDFDCDCARTRDGCELCCKKCDKCANIGCHRNHHFTVTSIDRIWLSPPCESEFCQGEPHCCGVKIYGEWDYMSCPDSNGESFLIDLERKENLFDSHQDV